MQQPVVSVNPLWPSGRRPSATLAVALAALLVALASLGVSVLDGSHSSACGGAERRIFPALGPFSAGWEVAGVNYQIGTTMAELQPAPSAQPVPSASSLYGPPRNFWYVQITCFGADARDVMDRETLGSGYVAIPAPSLGDESLAFRNDQGSFPQFILYIRQGGLIANVYNMGDVSEASVRTLAAAVDQAMARAR